MNEEVLTQHWREASRSYYTFVPKYNWPFRNETFHGYWLMTFDEFDDLYHGSLSAPLITVIKNK